MRARVLAAVLVALACVLMLVLSPTPALGGKRKVFRTQRDAAAGYAAPGVTALGTGDCVAPPASYNVTVGCVQFPVLHYERYVRLQVSDVAWAGIDGITVPVVVAQDIDGDGSWDVQESVCATWDGLSESIKIKPTLDAVVFLDPTADLPGCPGMATSGFVLARFSNLPSRTP